MSRLLQDLSALLKEEKVARVEKTSRRPTDAVIIFVLRMFEKKGDATNWKPYCAYGNSMRNSRSD